MRTSTPSTLGRVREWASARVAEGDRVAEEVAIANLRRMRWVLWVLIPFMLLHVLVFWFLRPEGTPVQREWKSFIGWAHLVAAGWMWLMGWLAQKAAARAVAGTAVRVLQTVIPLSCLVITASFALIDQRVTASISPYLIGCMFTSLLFLMRPLNALRVHVVGYLYFFAGLWFVGVDPAQLLSNRANGMGAAIMGVLLAVVLWRMNTDFLLLQRELRSRNEALVKQQDELLWMATHDPLTGLCNRREMLRLAEAELRRAVRQHTDTSVVMIDLDHFKRVNDLHGHLTGDGVLKHAASILSQGVRGTDCVARMGGEEFMILLPATGLEAAQKLAEKLLRLMRQSPARVSGELEVGVTASFGVATLPAGQSATLTWLYAAADHALYCAKSDGRDRVHFSEPDNSLTPSDFQRMRQQ